MSGTRLRAIHYAGPDGTRAPAGLFGGLFWDLEKQFYCVPTQAIPAVCAPIAASGSVTILDGGQVFSGYADSNCSVSIGANNVIWDGHARNLAAAGLPELRMTHWLHYADGGVTVTRGAPHAGPVYVRQFGGTCSLAGDTNAPGVVRDTGVVESGLAPLPLVRD